MKLNVNWCCNEAKYPQMKTQCTTSLPRNSVKKIQNPKTSPSARKNSIARQVILKTENPSAINEICLELGHIVFAKFFRILAQKFSFLFLTRGNFSGNSCLKVTTTTTARFSPWYRPRVPPSARAGATFSHGARPTVIREKGTCKSTPLF